MPDYRVAPTLRGLISVPGRTYAPGENIPAHLVSEELLVSGAVIVVEPEVEQPVPARKRGSK